MHEMAEERRQELARSFIAAAVQQLEEKIILALRKLEDRKLKALVVSGGVASNQYLRDR